MKPLALVLFLFSALLLKAQNKDLNYYLPDISYDASIPTPKSFLGYQVGDWHVSHDQLYYYMKNLAESSDKVTLTEYARSHENRPLIYLTISSVSNLNNIKSIQSQHQKLTQIADSDQVDISNLPAVIYQGHSIHGNEPSGANASMLSAYYLVAGQSEYHDKLLQNTVILFDPCYNPDGFNRFASWANTHKSKNLISDPNSRELNEAWPRGRTNHYWFDLNRDWLLLAHPESRGRVKVFQDWKPNILTDHHEMGSNSTFFFMPGIPSRTNPNTPQKNQDLTGDIGRFHAAALDSIGSMYYTKESYDDFYYGKGSTYPDANGSIGILFEQASSRGHKQKTVNGDLDFPFTIRNQVVTSLSTQKAALNLRTELLQYKRNFYKETAKEAKENNVKGYVFTEKHDKHRLNRFLETLLAHRIEVYALGNVLKKNGKTFEADHSYFVPFDQQQYKMAKVIFEEVHEFPDSLFYDVSAWTIPYAMNITCQPLAAGDLRGSWKGNRIESVTAPKITSFPKSKFAYLLDWNSFKGPSVLEALLSSNIVCKSLTKAYSALIDGKNHTFPEGTVLIPSIQENINEAALHEKISLLSKKYQVQITSLTSGINASGSSLGSRKNKNLKAQKILMIGGKGINSYECGAAWFVLDHLLDIPVTIVDIDQLSRVNFSDYTTIIMPDGSYSKMSSQLEKFKQWLAGGGNVIAMRRAIQYLKNQKIINLTPNEVPKADTKKDDTKKRLAYQELDAKRGAQVTGGCILKTKIDLTHPLFYGYQNEDLYVFRRGNMFYSPSTKDYATPAIYTNKPVASGYMSKENRAKAAGASAVTVMAHGKGRIVCFMDNPNFRGYWWGGTKMFANAIYFGDIIDGRSME